ncbi:hypothetical protein Lsai_3272 [Legionella sainthelensi]|uniref:Uncharacterized protein n=1 Tax=Legionella sainthelensi TaxID=28087 RepID=A0A0W0YCH3_9GAMM|nr:hypothetical protein [Legionella sainthelensi]KTD54450.1 hypothetical protein Lsai_3272 [Legionella sainthelensi]VEH33331.1 Uncharacterised protein [Legionella sainthelensi]
MNKLCVKMGVFAVLMSVSFLGWSGGACKAIAISCMQNGYFKGGEGSGKDLIKNCVIPVVAGTKTLPNTNFSPEQLQQCKMSLAEKMKDKMQQKAQTQQPQTQQPETQQPPQQ